MAASRVLRGQLRKLSIAASSASRPRRNAGSFGRAPTKPSSASSRPSGEADVGPADHVVAPQQRHRVVAEPALLRPGVGLEPVGPAPQMLEPPPVPHDRIERRQQAHRVRRCRGAPPAAGRPEIADAIHLAALQFARLPAAPPPSAAIRPAPARHGRAGRMSPPGPPRPAAPGCRSPAARSPRLRASGASGSGCGTAAS